MSQTEKDIADSAIELYYTLLNNVQPVCFVAFNETTIIVCICRNNTISCPNVWQGWDVTVLVMD